MCAVGSIFEVLLQFVLFQFLFLEIQTPCILNTEWDNQILWRNNSGSQIQGSEGC